jgi:hypothetical protein
MTTEPQWISVKEFQARNPGLGLNLIYRSCKNGDLPSIRIGSKVMIRSDALDLMLSSKTP